MVTFYRQFVPVEREAFETRFRYNFTGQEVGKAKFTDMSDKDFYRKFLELIST